jgi:glutathione S-transferase
MSLTLHYTPHTCALATHIVLEEAGAAYDLVRVDFKRTEQRSPAFLALNPKGRVPALVTNRGVLTETPALLAFVAQSYPKAKLAPLDDPFAFADVQAFNSYLCSTVHVAHAHGMRGYRWVDDPAAIAAMKRKVPESLSACYEPIEASFLKGPWVTGDSYSIADCYLFTIAQWLEDDGVDPKRFPRILEHRERVMERPAVKRALEQERLG